MTEEQKNMDGGPTASGAPLADDVGFELLGDELGAEVGEALNSALVAGAVFPDRGDPLVIFRSTLMASIRDIECSARGRLLQRFLAEGPYEREGEIPPELRGKRLTEVETEAAITFIYSFMVNSFKGALTELLAAAACSRLIQDLVRKGGLPPSVRLYVGDSVMLPRKSGKGSLKGADLHLLVLDDHETKGPRVTVAGVAEVKSGRKSAGAMGKQLDQHIARARQGMQVAGVDFPPGRVHLAHGRKDRILRITVQPSDWRLPHTIRFESTGENRQLILDPPTPPSNEDQIIPIGDHRWHISLRWSKEAIAAAAFDMTFWYMEMVGEIIYTKKGSEPDPIPKEWAGMTPAEAGRNAVKMMLYYAIRPYALKDNDGTLSMQESRTMQRAIALYNCYGFGYALGMNFRNPAGRREMLWPEDLDEIAATGRNKDGCRIV
jgi:hypothetical protein